MLVLLLSISFYIMWLLLLTTGLKKRIYKIIMRILLILSTIIVFFYTKFRMFMRVWFSYEVVKKLNLPPIYHNYLRFWLGSFNHLNLHKKLTVLPFWPWFCITYYYYWQARSGRTRSTWKVPLYCERTSARTKDNRIVFDLRTDFLAKYTRIVLNWFWVPIRSLHYRWAIKITKIIFKAITFVRVTKFGETLVVLFFRNGENHSRGWLRLYIVMVITWFVLAKLFCDYYSILGPVFSTIIIIISTPIFILWQTFVFFFKSYQISKFTSANQMFWKRALFLFWALESFLFLISLFIIFISPDNLKIGVGHRIMHLQIFVSPIDILEMLWIPTLLIIYARSVLLKKKNNSNINRWLLFTNYLIFFILVCELNQLLGVYNMSNVDAVITKNLGGCEVLQLVEFSREDVVSNQMKLLLLFIKFWHVLFIAGFVKFVTIRTLEMGSISYDLMSATIYNLNYLFIFNILFLCYAHNKVLYFIFMEIPNYYGSSTLDQFLYQTACGLWITIKAIFGF